MVCQKPLLLNYNLALNIKLDNFYKIGNLKKNRKVPKHNKDTGNLQILLHLRSLFQLHVIALH